MGGMHHTQAKCLLKQGEKAKALRCTESALDCDPHSVKAMLVRGHCLVAMGSLHEAETLIRQEALPLLSEGGGLQDPSGALKASLLKLLERLQQLEGRATQKDITLSRMLLQEWRAPSSSPPQPQEAECVAAAASAPSTSPAESRGHLSIFLWSGIVLLLVLLTSVLLLPLMGE